MADEPFMLALRAELDAVVARYDVLARARQETQTAVMEGRLQLAEGRLGVVTDERDRLRSVADSLQSENARLTERVRALTDEVAMLRDKVEKERRKATETASRTASSLAEARMQIGELTAQLDAVSDQAQVFEDTFAGEMAFVEASLGAVDTQLFDALQEAAEVVIEQNASVYGALKAIRLDVVLTRAVKARGRVVLSAPLLEQEQESLERMAEAAGCALIEPALGDRYDPSTMDKTESVPDPSEDGNVLACLMPGLRLGESEGALVFPKVRVAVA